MLTKEMNFHPIAPTPYSNTPFLTQHSPQDGTEKVSLLARDTFPPITGAFSPVPKDILIHIFSFLRSETIPSLQQVCKGFYIAAQSELLWKRWAKERQIGETILSVKEAVIRSFSFEKALQTGNIYCVNTLDGHEGHVNCLLFAEGKLISGSYDTTIKIWDLAAGKEIITLTGHKDAVNCLLFAEGKFISSSRDKTIKIWDFATGKEIKTLTGHQDSVNRLIYAEGKLISSSRDKTIKIWDLAKGKETRDLDGHRGAVNCLIYAEGKLISGSYDTTIKIWDLAKGKETRTLGGHQSLVTCLLFAEGKFISGSWDKTIKIWGPRSRETSIQKICGIM